MLGRVLYIEYTTWTRADRNRNILLHVEDDTNYQYNTLSLVQYSKTTSNKVNFENVHRR
jgi:hypothetical protein